MEILSNTIIRLISRQGADSDRKNVLLNSGEFGYSSDTRRLFIGNGYSNGGDVVGNKFTGRAVNITTLAPAEIGDFAYDTDHNKLYQLNVNDGSTITDWECVAGVYSSADGYLNIGLSNEISLNPLSANALSNDLVSGSIILDSGRLALSANLPFQSVSTNTITVSSGLDGYVDGNKLSSGVNTLSSNLVLLSNQLHAVYDGLSGQTLRYSRNITSVTRLSAGNYKFNYGPLPTANIYPIITIYGSDVITAQVRTITFNNSACYVKVLSGNNTTTTDANVIITISY